MSPFLDALNSVVHSHRFKKGDEFTEGIDFSLIRGVLYSYSIEARNSLLEDKLLGFLFLHFIHVHK